MALNIKIENFEGPFDLLLHLIKINEMDIYDIKIYDITNQYIKYLDKMNEMDLEVTSEFIVLAATLIQIKSCMLLPKDNEDSEELSVDYDDPKKELIERLIEYKKFKAAAEYLKLKEIETGISYSKKPEIIEDNNVDVSELFKSMTLLNLYDIFNNIIERYYSKLNSNSNFNKRISIDEYKIEDKMVEIADIVKRNGVTSFGDILSKSIYKIEKIVYFLALLELIKLKEITIVQNENFKEIYLEGIDNNGQNQI